MQGLLNEWRRTNYTKNVTPDLTGQDVIVMGWVHEIRDLIPSDFFFLFRKVITITAITYNIYKTARCGIENTATESETPDSI